MAYEDKRYTGPVYDIPSEMSPVPYFYFLNQNTYDLERLKEQYEANLRSNPRDNASKECIETIEDVLRKRKNENK